MPTYQILTIVQNIMFISDYYNIKTILSTIKSKQDFASNVIKSNQIILYHPLSLVSTIHLRISTMYGSHKIVFCFLILDL